LVTSARGSGQLPPEVAELHDLRREVQQLRREQLETVGRMRDAERRSAEMTAELAAQKEGDGLSPSGAADRSNDADEPPAGEGTQAARSLRSRLAQTAARRKGDPDASFGS
jgi:hypothetical protein